MQFRFRGLGLKLIGINLSRPSKNRSKENFESHTPFENNDIEVIRDPMDSERLFVTRWYDFTSLKRRRISINLKQKSSLPETDSVSKLEDKKNDSTKSEIKKLSRNILDDTSDTSQDVQDESMQKTLKIYEETKHTLPREYFVMFTIIFLESGTISLDRLVAFLGDIHITNHFFDPNFDETNWTINENVEDDFFDYRKTNKVPSTQALSDALIYKMKREGYLKMYKDDDAQIHVTFDWRFHAECPSFNPTIAVESFCKLH